MRTISSAHRHIFTVGNNATPLNHVVKNTTLPIHAQHISAPSGLEQTVNTVSLTHHPDDVALLEGTLGINHRKVLLALFYSHDHAVIVLAYAALAERLADKGATGVDDETVQPHLPLLDIGVFGHKIATEFYAEGMQLLVVADDLYLVFGEEDGGATGDVDATVTAQDAAHEDAEARPPLQTGEALAGEGGIEGNLKLGYM